MQSENKNDIEIENNWSEVVKSFDNMGLRESLLRGIFNSGFERPSPIQERAVVPCAGTRDVIAQAQSGMGKTATFAIGVLNKIDPSIKTCQALILAPVRELAQQIRDVMENLSAYMGITCVVVTGGVTVREDADALRRGAQVVVGTPGRVLDLLERRMLDMSRLKSFVMDEADEMLSRGFKDQIFDIFQLLPYESMQTILVSATMPLDALDMTRKFMNDPIRILLKQEQLALSGIKQYFVFMDDPSWKYSCLKDIYETLPVTQSIIFVNARHTAERLAHSMSEDDFTVSVIHADLSFDERKQVMARFRSSQSRVLISTDLLSRGIDVQQVSLVVNYELPRQKEAYVHRIGRCGRWGRKGVVINFVTEAEARQMNEIAQHYSYDITEMPRDINAELA